MLPGLPGVQLNAREALSTHLHLLVNGLNMRQCGDIVKGCQRPSADVDGMRNRGRQIRDIVKGNIKLLQGGDLDEGSRLKRLQQGGGLVRGSVG